MKKNKHLEKLTVKLEAQKEPWNKMQTQRRFYSTKSAIVEKPSSKMVKPMWEEKKQFLRNPVWNQVADSATRDNLRFLNPH